MSQNYSESEKQAKFKEFYSENYSKGMRYALSYKVPFQDAQDMVHHCFVIAWNRFDDYLNQDNPYWFKNILHNKIRYDLAKSRRKGVIHYAEHIEDFATQRMTPEEKLLHVEKSLKIQMIVDQLPENYRLIFTRRLSGIPYKEIAEELQITVKSAQRRMERAIAILRSDLQDFIKELLDE